MAVLAGSSRAQLLVTNRRVGAHPSQRRGNRHSLITNAAVELWSCDNGLQWCDTKEGSGPSPALRSTVRCHYEGRFSSNGKVFDSSRNGVGPITFTIGVGQVIKGWDLGILGSEAHGIPPMREGGRRRLVIPADLAYGAAGFGNGIIPPNAKLEFDVELLGKPNPLEQMLQDFSRLLAELKSGV